jgi:hypothetical protein
LSKKEFERVGQSEAGHDFFPSALFQMNPWQWSNWIEKFGNNSRSKWEALPGITESVTAEKV